eukprot:UN04598
MSKIVKHQWHLFDANGQVVGRFATHIANVLRGKYKPTYTKNADCGDTVVIINADKVTFTGKKWEQKVYSKHSGFIGGLTQKKASHIRERYPERILLHAVRGMIPKTVHKLPQLGRLHVYAGEHHPFKHIFPNQPIPRAVEKDTNIVGARHFRVLEEFEEEVKKKAVEIPTDARGAQDSAAWLRINHPEEYAELMAECEVRLSAEEFKEYKKVKATLQRRITLQKVIDKAANLETKFKYGTELDKVTLDTLKQTRPELFNINV